MPSRTRWLQVQRRAWNFHVVTERQTFVPTEAIRAGRHPRELKQRQLEWVDRLRGCRGRHIPGVRDRGTVSPGDKAGRLLSNPTSSPACRPGRQCRICDRRSLRWSEAGGRVRSDRRHCRLRRAHRNSVAAFPATHHSCSIACNVGTVICSVCANSLSAASASSAGENICVA